VKGYIRLAVYTGLKCVVERLGEMPIVWLGNVTGAAAVWHNDVGRIYCA